MVDGAGQDAVPFQTPQGHGEHALADPVDSALEFDETARPLVEAADHQERPLVPDRAEDDAGLARVRCARLLVGVIVTSREPGHRKVPY